MWQKYGECPENTIPIRRTKKEEILRAKSLESFGKKNHQYIPEDTSSPNYHHEVHTLYSTISIGISMLAYSHVYIQSGAIFSFKW